MIKNDEIDFIVNITEDKKAIADSYEIRRNALQNKHNLPSLSVVCIFHIYTSTYIM